MPKRAELARGTALGRVAAGVEVVSTSVEFALPAEEFETVLQDLIASKMGKPKAGLVRSINLSLQGDKAVFVVTDHPKPVEPEATLD